MVRLTNKLFSPSYLRTIATLTLWKRISVLGLLGIPLRPWQMMTKRSNSSYVLKAILYALALTPLVAQSPAPASALPAGVPNVKCGSLSNPQPGDLCYTVTLGGGKVSANGKPKKFPTIIIQATEPEYVIADVILKITSSAGDKTLPSVNQISPGGQAAIVSTVREQQRELKRLISDLQTKATVLAGPALIEAEAKLRTLREQEEIFESVVITTIVAGQDAGKFAISGASARSRKCGTLNLDTCGSWVEYKVYTVKRYVGNPIAAYNRVRSVAQDASSTITRLANLSQQPPSHNPDSRQILFRNECRFPIQLALRYQPQTNEWVTNGWWSIDGGRNTYLASNDQRIKLSNSLIYYYAEISQEPHKNYTWSGDQVNELNGRTLRMRQRELTPDSRGDYVLSIDCKNL